MFFPNLSLSSSSLLIHANDTAFFKSLVICLYKATFLVSPQDGTHCLQADDGRKFQLDGQYVSLGISQLENVAYKSVFIQFGPKCFTRLTWIFSEIGGKEPYINCSVKCGFLNAASLTFSLSISAEFK